MLWCCIGKKLLFLKNYTVKMYSTSPCSCGKSIFLRKRYLFISTLRIEIFNIGAISFDDKLKSDFYFKGNKISAKINDVDFYKRVDKGESFAKGDVLEVELEIKQVFETSVNTFVNKSYKIKRIINHILRNEQSKLDFDNEF